MLQTFANRNKYGGYTHEIQITPLIIFKFTEKDTQTIEIELLEKRIFRKDKVYFSFISHDTLGGSVIKAFGRMKIESDNLPFDIDFRKLNNLEDRVLAFLLEYRHEIMKRSIVKL